jgi:hypothetical protein
MTWSQDEKSLEFRIISRILSKYPGIWIFGENMARFLKIKTVVLI